MDNVFSVNMLLAYHERVAQAPSIERLARRCMPELRQHQALIEEKLYPQAEGAVECLILCHVSDELVGAISMAIHGPAGRRVAGVRTLLVDPAFRKRGVASRLIRAAESQAVSHEASRVWLYCSLPNYLYPGAPLNDSAIAGFAQALGYAAVVNTYDMGVDLQHQSFNTACSEGEIRAVATPAQAAQLLAFCAEQFPAFEAEVRMALGRIKPIAYVVVLCDQVIGFCVAGANNAPLGVIGPAGIHPEHRRTNAFRCLLESCMTDLQQRGHTFARMQWSDPRSPTFYRRYFDGFVCGEFVIYAKDLS
ncbi:GNAT family N-acetyltransferase [Pseudomonas fluorescens]|uniref:GNAT family N-acetyltransferase n=1 Tax=Pseudomonas fluorescens TaxID=294 RepID=UPI00177D2782|nr:GNAT family N-acetyltransferase [Pseudomonas fluorescens]MBD8099205.1 GNAT family N-acetyltransferase [Pseudomonas fluorescens]MBD8774124.1 GNAT family N-acetyltransferase [Pseudomonas fluorescens]MBD8780846.1 GNAT family N-acetyltransferase [Pseudomonas fluorescens]MBD8796723.1 GNAT family N-acetyltransferase [Pseudomonas fluorescens]